MGSLILKYLKIKPCARKWLFQWWVEPHLHDSTSDCPCVYKTPFFISYRNGLLSTRDCNIPILFILVLHVRKALIRYEMKPLSCKRGLKNSLFCRNTRKYHDILELFDTFQISYLPFSNLWRFMDTCAVSAQLSSSQISSYENLWFLILANGRHIDSRSRSPALLSAHACLRYWC